MLSHQGKYYLLSNCFLILISLLFSFPAYNQENASFVHSAHAVQYGGSLKLQAEIGRREGFNFRLTVSGGIGAYAGSGWFYPSIQSDLMIYYGGLGSRYQGNKKKKIDLEPILSYTLTFGGQDRMKQGSKLRPGLRNYPLYYFNNWNLPALQNPFNWSASWGGNIIFFPTHPKHKKQLVGFLNLHLDRFQLNYLNDGPPFFQPFGDRFDRFHTGAGFISFHGDDDWPLNLVEFGYNKFSGYTPYSYETANKMGSSYVLYKDSVEYYYNKSNWHLQVANTNKNYGVSVINYNKTQLDIQHKIHFSSYYPYHLVPYQPNWSFGALTYYQQTSIGLQK